MVCAAAGVFTLLCVFVVTGNSRHILAALMILAAAAAYPKR